MGWRSKPERTSFYEMRRVTEAASKELIKHGLFIRVEQDE